jgi:hypothetical protein
MRLLYFNIVLSILFMINIDIYAQFVDTPLRPAKDKVPGWSGILVGVGQNFQSGEYYVDCEDCIFDGGVNTGFTVGLSYDRKALDWLKYGVAVFYDYSGIKNSFTETELIPFELDNSGIKENIPIQFRHTANVDLHLLTAMPYIKFEPLSFYFFRMGFGAGYIFNSHLTHDKELMQNTATLSNGAKVSVSIPGSSSNKVTIQESQVNEINSLQLYLMPATGLKINFSETTYLLTYVQFNLPLNNISEYGSNYKINQWRLFFELGFKMH